MLSSKLSGRTSIRAFSSAPVPQLRSLHVARARMRDEDPVYFNDIYEGLMDRLQDNFNPLSTPKSLPREETYLLLQSIKSKDHAQKALKVLNSEFESTKELALNDWHIRKKYYTSLAIKAVQNECPEVLQQLLENMQELKVPTYFVKDLIATLGKRRQASFELLKQLLDTLEQQRGTEDVGVAHAYYELITVCQRRELSSEALQLFDAAASKGVALSSGLMKYKDSLTGAAPVAAPAAAPAAEPEAAPAAAV